LDLAERESRAEFSRSFHLISRTERCCDSARPFTPSEGLQPGRITAKVPVDLSRPRGAETRRFMALAKELRHILVATRTAARLG